MNTTCIFVLLLLLVLVSSPFSSGWWRRRRRRNEPSPTPPDNTAPRFTVCPSAHTTHSTVYSTTTVTWNNPVATDNRGTPTVTRSGPAPGSSFRVGNHTITYTAVDGAGNTARCIVRFTVERILCPSIGSPNQRSFDCSDGNNVYSICSFMCSTGYYLSGTSPVECQEDGTWSENLPSCKIHVCPLLTNPIHGRVSCSSNTFGATCYYHCDNGYTLSGSSSTICLGSYWSEPPASCTDTEAPTFTDCPSDIFVTNDDRRTSAVVTYEIPKASDNSGITPAVYKVNGQDSGTNFSSGIHEVRYRATDSSDNSADCIFSITVTIISCPLISFQNHRTYTCPHGNLKGATCTFECDVGYTISGVTNSTCASNGTWASNLPNCTDVFCPALTVPDNGYMTTCGTQFNSLCSFSCHEGFDLLGSPSRTCTHVAGETHGFWTGSQPTCTIRKCPLPTVEGELQLLNDSKCQINSDYTVIYGSVCQYTCSVGYRIAGSQFRTCLASGNWLEDLPECNVLTCDIGDLPVIANGSWTECPESSIIYGDTCTLICNHGYQSRNQSEKTCGDHGLEYGVWSNETITCSVVTCKELTSPMNGTIDYCKNGNLSISVTGDQTVGTTCAMECAIGFTLTSGSPRRTCLVSGKWDGQDSICSDKTPPLLKCPANVAVFSDAGQTTASLSWEWEPLTAIDVSGQYVAILTEVDGQPVEGRPTSFEEGNHALTYTVSDNSGNNISCSFDVYILVNECPPPEVPENGVITNNSCSETRPSTLGDICDFSCVSGYEVASGNRQRECVLKSNITTQGIWSGDLLECTRVQCPLPPLYHGHIIGCNIQAVFYEETCQFVCDSGYRTPDGESVSVHTCQADRNWDNQAFDCSAQITCPALRVPSYGTISPSDCSILNMPYGTICDTSCNLGYGLNGTKRVECLDSGYWSDSGTTTCTDIEAPVFTDICPKNIEVTADKGQTTWTGKIEQPAATDNSGNVTVQRKGNFSEGVYSEGITSVTFEAFDLSGNTAICIHILTVEVKRCKNLGHPDGGFVQSCDTFYGSTCNISCKSGYEHSFGATERTCELDENGIPFWSGADTICTIHTCPVLNQPESTLPSRCGGSLGNLPSTGTVCSFFCQNGFIPRGRNTLECLHNGTWSENSFLCEAILCRNLEITGVRAAPQDCASRAVYGMQCTLECPPGFSISPFIVTCLGTGEWSSDINELRCKDTTPPVFVSCPPPGDLTFFTSPTNRKARATWSLTATDNSNSTITINCQPQSGSWLVPGKHTVGCIAVDSEENTRQCVFNVEIKDRTCSSLMPPVHGSFEGTCNHKEGDNCTFTCNIGYRLEGHTWTLCEKVNNETVSWVPASRPSCEAVTCGPLTFFDDRGNFTPSICHDSNSLTSGVTCNLFCGNAFTLQSNSSDVQTSIQCNEDGSWNTDIEETFSCVDKVAPEIKFCPSPIFVTQTNISQPVTVSFDLPLAVDNSHEDIKPVLTPPVMSPHSFNQSTTIHCLFQDSSGNQNWCHIEVILTVQAPPVITKQCPDDMVVDASGSQSEISWDEPVFSDPGGEEVDTLSNFSPGSTFTLGNHTVNYYGQNRLTGQRTQCSFEIAVVSQSCPTLEAPANGVLACHETDEAHVCVLSCLPGYQTPPFQRSRPHYTCLLGSTWTPSSVVSNCAATSPPFFTRMPATVSYTAINCSGDHQLSAASDAVTSLEQHLNTFLHSLCSDSNGCFVRNITVICGEVNIHRRRRSPEEEISDTLGWIFEFDVIVRLNISENNIENSSHIELVQAANNTLHTFANQFVNALPSEIDLSGTESILLVPNSVETNDVVLACETGFIPDAENTHCVACVEGYFYREGKGDCHPCPVGTYQDESLQTNCKMCPSETSTILEGAKSLEDCFDLCPPGTYSTDGLFSCQKCPTGYYQPASGQTRCLQCPPGSTTAVLGSISVSQCAAPCSVGTKSPNGLHPCTPCPRRYYQPDTNQRFCLICDGQKTTEGVGSVNQSQCTGIDFCSSQPCQNSGECQSYIEGYICVCIGGFEGRNCEMNVNECKHQPCRNGGICVDDINAFKCICVTGFTGPDCSMNINECDSNPCLNGALCEDIVGSFFCHCPQDFEGRHCETRKNPCNSAPCINNGLCLNYIQGYKCLCPSAFTGNNCEQRKRPCYKNPCSSGDCVDVGGGQYECLCFKGFEGEHCDITIDFCADVKCENGGQCHQTTERAICVCPPEYAGQFCDRPRTICDDGNCLNGATCQIIAGTSHQWNEYSCECVPGFTGQNCEDDIDECVSMPCSKQATCLDMVDGYKCECSTGYEAQGQECRSEGP